MRIDKYLWAIRIYKTRSKATKASNEDKILLNSVNIKPSKTVKLNDLISVKSTPIWRTYKVLDIPKSRVGANSVDNFAIETTSEKDLEQFKQYEIINRQNRSLGTKGRPTKKDRRNLRKWFN